MRLVAVAVLVVSVATLLACGDGGDTSTAPVTVEPRESQLRRVPATEQEQRAGKRATARDRRRAAARRRAEARERRRQVRAQQRALNRSSPENAPGDDCAEGYDPCVPPYPPDVDCAELSGPYRVTPPDPHKLDPDGDGRAC